MGPIREYGAVIIAGGQGRRMGGLYKGGLKLGGQCFLERLADSLEDFEERFLAVKEEGQIPPEEKRRLLDWGFTLLTDQEGEEGPLAGLHAGLERTRGRGILAVAADTPLFDRQLARRLCALSAGRQWDACLCRSGGRLHPLGAVYEKTCLPVIRSQIKEKNFRLLDVAGRVKCGYLELAPEDPRLFNVNRLEDYRQLLRAAGEKPEGESGGI